MMKNWHIHSTWIIGILLAMLIGTTSVHWNSIKDLPGIISFAVGLSSLILAVIAIFQSLTSTSSVENALAAVREAAEGAGQVAVELAASTSKITLAADDAQQAAAAALRATADYGSVSNRLLSATEAGREAIHQLREDMKGKEAQPRADAVQNEDVQPAFDNVTMGGAALLYAVIKSYETGKPFVLAELFSKDISTSYETGYLAALDNAGLISYSMDNGVYRIKSVNKSIIEAEHPSERTYTKKTTQEAHERRVKQVEEYFKETV